MRHRLAFLISRVFGPLPLLCLLWLATAFKSGIGFWKALWVYPLLFIVEIAIPFAITTLIIFKSRGRVNIEWSNINDRKIFAPIILFFWTIALIGVWYLTNNTIFHLSLLAGLLTISAFIITLVFHFKISLHMMAASGVFWGVNFLTHFNYWWLFLLLIPIVWARKTLKVHTLTELIGGLILANSLIILATLLFGWPKVP